MDVLMLILTIPVLFRLHKILDENKCMERYVKGTDSLYWYIYLHLILFFVNRTELEWKWNMNSDDQPLRLILLYVYRKRKRFTNGQNGFRRPHNVNKRKHPSMNTGYTKIDFLSSV